MHPAVYLWGWLWLAVAAQFLDSVQLLALLLLLPLAGGRALRRWRRMLWRAKWLLLTIALVISYAQPGVLIAGLAWAPSREGLHLALHQALILIVMLGGLACVMSRLSRTELLVGMLVPMRCLLPAAWVERGVARLLLTLEYVDHSPGKGAWKKLLQSEALPAPQKMTLDLPAWRTRDVLALAMPVLIAFTWGVLR